MYQEKNMRKLNEAPVLFMHDESHAKAILLETGPHDEAVRYFALAQPVGYSGEYLVYVSESSLLLDLVRFKRSMNVVASFSPDARFLASISLASMPALLSQTVLSLTIKGPAEEISCEGDRFCPVT